MKRIFRRLIQLNELKRFIGRLIQASVSSEHSVAAYCLRSAGMKDTPASEHHRSKWLLLLIGCCTLVCLNIPFNAFAQDDEPRPIFKPHGPCFSTRGGVQIVVHASPDLGGAAPTVLVAPASTVRLSGIARKFLIRENCTTTFTPLLTFAWKLLAQQHGGVFTDESSILKHADTLFPTFDPVGGTLYIAQLAAGGQTGFVRIEALKGRSWYSIGPNGSVGPEGVGNVNVGRVNDLVFDPSSALVLYAATAQGGVFKSLDRGEVWFPITDHKGLPNLGISALAVSQLGSGQTIIFAAVGDNLAALAVRVGVGSGSGIWRSRDGGLNWESSQPVPPATCPAGTVVFSGNANRIVASPNASDIYVAAQQGFFRSNDGGNCWTNLGLNNVTDVVLDPSNPQILYVAVPQLGIFKTTAATTVSSFPSPPLFQFGAATSRVRLAIAPSSPSVVYAAIADGPAKNTFLLRSSDGGAKWSVAANSLCANQCNFGIALAADPKDANHVVFGGVEVYHSTDGAATFSDVGLSSSVHNDFHALVFAPDNAREIYAGTDGGVFRNSFSSDRSHTPNDVWESRNFELSIAQAATLDLTPTNSQGAAIGVWDNGSQARLVGRAWKSIQGGDGFVVAADAASDQIIYYNDNAGISGSATSRYPDRTGLGNVVAVTSNPFRPGELFGIGVAAKSDNKLYVARGADKATTPDWRCADPAPAGVAAFNVEFSPDGFYYLSSWNGSIYRFKLPNPLPNLTQCGASGTAASGSAIFNQTASQILQPPKIALDPFDSKGLYAVVPGSPAASLIVKLTPFPAAVGGTGWKTTPIAGKLKLPAGVRPQTIGADPSLRGVLYLGTTNGLWVGLPDSNGNYTWSQDLSVPDTMITSIVPHRNDGRYSGVLRVGTFGRGVWERQLTLARLINSCRTLQCVAPAISAFSCLNCERGPYQALPTESNPEAWVAVPYVSKVNPGAHAVVRATPLSKREPQPFFLIEGQRAIQGVNLALVQLRYAAVDAPTELHTDSLRLEILRTPGGPVLSSRIVPFERWWARPDARLLTVNAAISDPAPTPPPVTVSVRVGARVIEGTAPLTVALPLGSTIYVQVTPHFESMYRIAYFNRWTNGDRVTGDKSLLKITVSDNILLTAHYAFR